MRVILAPAAVTSARKLRGLVLPVPGWQSAVAVFWRLASPLRSSYPLAWAKLVSRRLNSRCHWLRSGHHGLPLAGRWRAAGARVVSPPPLVGYGQLERLAQAQTQTLF